MDRGGDRDYCGRGTSADQQLIRFKMTETNVIWFRWQGVVAGARVWGKTCELWARYE